MLFVHSNQAIFLLFLFFCYIIMYILSIISALKKMTIKELKSFTYENYHRRIRFLKQILFNETSEEKNVSKLIENISNVTNDK